MKKSSIAKRQSKIAEDRKINVNSFHSTNGSGKTKKAVKEADTSKSSDKRDKSFHAKMGSRATKKATATMVKNKSGNSFRG